MIKAILVFNNQGKPRLTKFYQYQSEILQQQIIRETFQLVAQRDGRGFSFIEGGLLVGDEDFKLVYRQYAALYFVFCVDSSESELGILDLIRVFVEALDNCFENVCEFDLIFHMDRVHCILNELVFGGLVLETCANEITARYEEQAILQKPITAIVLAGAAPAKRLTKIVKDLNIPQKFQKANLPDLVTVLSRKFH